MGAGVGVKDNGCYFRFFDKLFIVLNFYYYYFFLFFRERDL